MKNKDDKQDIDPHFFENIARMWCIKNGIERDYKEVIMHFAVFVDETLAKKPEPKKEDEKN